MPSSFFSISPRPSGRHSAYNYWWSRLTGGQCGQSGNHHPILHPQLYLSQIRVLMLKGTSENIWSKPSCHRSYFPTWTLSINSESEVQNQAAPFCYFCYIAASSVEDFLLILLCGSQFCGELWGSKANEETPCPQEGHCRHSKSTVIGGQYGLHEVEEASMLTGCLRLRTQRELLLTFVWDTNEDSWAPLPNGNPH